MGNKVVSSSSSSSVKGKGKGKRKGKVILSNGSVFSYEGPLTVAELMLDHPQQVVVELESEKAIPGPPLPADHTLHFQNLYLMLPISEARKLVHSRHHHILSKTTKLLLPIPYTGLLPLLIRIYHCTNNTTTTNNFPPNTTTTTTTTTLLHQFLEEGRPEFLSKQMSGKGWKPSLDPIKEKTMKPKLPHLDWVF